MNTALNPDRYFSPEPATREVARELYQIVAAFPIFSPHGQVDPRLFADPNATLGSPADLFIIPDHYVTRMLYSQGIPLEKLGVPQIAHRRDAENAEQENNKINDNDDTRAFCSIPARHDLWRRASANWLAGLVARHILDMDDAYEMIRELAVGLA